MEGAGIRDGALGWMELQRPGACAGASEGARMEARDGPISSERSHGHTCVSAEQCMYLGALSACAGT